MGALWFRGPWLAGGLALALGAGVSVQVARLDLEQQAQAQRAQVFGQLVALQAQLVGVLKSTFSATSGLVYLTSHQERLPADQFNGIARRTLARLPQIRNIAVAPDDQVQLVYPLIGNEAVLGFRYQTRPEQWATVLRARQQRRALLAGPVKLVQGGEALIVREPVFLDALTPDAGPRYWGVISIVVSVAPLLKAGGLVESHPLALHLVGSDAQGDSGAPIWGDARVAQQQPVRVPVEVPGGEWTLMATPQGGWQAPPFWMSSYFQIGLLNSLLLAAFVVALLSRQLRLRESQQRFTEMAGSIDQVFYVAAPDLSRFDYVSPAYEQMFGLPAGTLLHNPRAWWDAVHPDDVDLLRSRLRGGSWLGKVQTLWRARRADGELRQLCTSAFAVKGADGRVQRIVGVVEDVTERLQAEQALLDLNNTLDQRVRERTAELSDTLLHLRQTQHELVRSEKLAALGAMVAGVAHQLNTPLGSSLTLATALQHQLDEFEAGTREGVRRSTLTGFVGWTREALVSLVRNLLHATRLVEGFKQAAADQAGSPRRSFLLDELVQEVLVTLQPLLQGQTVAVAVQQDLAPDLRLESYPGALSQVLTHLIENALLHGLQGCEAPQLRIVARRLDDCLVSLSVIDNGRGIAAEHLPRIFDPFFTTRLGQGGSGLGLHEVHKLVTGVLGGRVEVESTVGQGCCFKLTLPFEAPPMAPTEVQEVSAEAAA
ncbi:MAG: CHASE domain-containing protein [Burkholderiaceae bacterium]|nr:CHASE domain-containing protein [Burkholderiaceae bacterium]